MDDHPLSPRYELELLSELQRAANERAAAEATIHAEHSQTTQAAKKQLRRESSRISAEHQEASETALSEALAAHEALVQSHDQQRKATEEEYASRLRTIEREYKDALGTALEAYREARWEALTLFDAQKDQPQKLLEDATARLRNLVGQLERIHVDVQQILKERHTGLRHGADLEISTQEEQANWEHTFAEAESMAAECVTAARDAATRLYQLKLPRVYQAGGIATVLIAAAAISVPLTGAVMNWSGFAWLPIGLGGGMVIAAGLMAGLWPQVKRSTMRTLQDYLGARNVALAAIKSTQAVARREAEELALATASRRDEALTAADREQREVAIQVQERRDVAAVAAQDTYPARLEDLDAAYQAALHQHEQQTASARQAIDDARQSAQRQAEVTFETCTEQADAEREQRYQQMRDAWFAILERFSTAISHMNGRISDCFREWTELADAYRPPSDSPPAIPLGSVSLDFTHVRNALSNDEELIPSQISCELPAVFNLLEHACVVLLADGAGKQAAVRILHAIMLRFLTAVPPAKTRFTLIDPAGLGDNFAAFSRLADYDDQLLGGGRIWTEPQDIDQRLLELTVHMETVIQKYLRNDYETIHDYNSEAGEVAEPYRVIVIANFPTGFSEASIRRLLNIAATGSRCGVYVLMSIDRGQRLPGMVKLDDLLEASLQLDWQRDEFVWQYGAFARLPLRLETPPSPETLRKLLSVVGEAAAAAGRVEVPFEVVVPQTLGGGECDREIVIPVGRAGARQLQSVQLGRGTSQHVLVAGKTGSGKSTFLHALITSAAAHYAPDQLEFYLIDFKKGVEFKAYAGGRLPHARVIAIESEREFGLSVLERLGAELKSRGDRFRALGVQDLAAYRAAVPGQPVPRILLIVDEFQELFVEDDRLAQEASLLLDRLVRQGRAFGIHVLLGSQTLGGAYSLPRTTLGQMAVRVALQCSESDAHLILSEDNTAARLLSRPGEAIYNDQNGLVSGNQPFQVVWLPDSVRDAWLDRIRDAYVDDPSASAEAIVFEGNQPAELTANRSLIALLEREPPTARLAPRIWLGDAVSIKDPTSLVFRRQSGGNLLVVGHREGDAVGMLASSLVALSAQSGFRDEASEARFDVLDGTTSDSVAAGYWNQMASHLPATLHVAAVADGSQTIAEYAREVTRRVENRIDDGAGWFLVVYNLGRFRELRRSEDDFSFSVDRDKPPKPDRQLATILHEGPAVGVHVIVWSESVNNVNRAFDRQALREFEYRVVMPLSAADSTTLIDTPAAARLGPHRALFYSGDEGTLEKFRHYAPPAVDALEALFLRVPSP